MSALPPDLDAHLKGRATTLCTCWQLHRVDGAVLGFTDHDRDLIFDGIVHRSGTGVAASADMQRAGFGVGGLEIDGAFASGGLDAGELGAGLYDGARFDAYLVNWADLTQRVLRRRGTLGEVTASDGGFRAEIRGPAEQLQAVRGRVFSAACDADLGDARCKVVLDADAFSTSAAISAVETERRFRADALSGFPIGWFNSGTVRFTAGGNQGRRLQVKLHAASSLGIVLELHGAPLQPIAVGDAFEATAGCDKRFATCCTKFGNAANFRGFPHIPGNDAALAYASAGDANDGSARS